MHKLSKVNSYHNYNNLGGKAVTFWDIAQGMELIDESNGDISNLVLWVDTNTRLQLNADALANGMTIVDSGRTVNGINISTVQTPLGNIGIYTGQFLPAGTLGVFNLDIVHPVYQETPGKGNFLC